MTSQPIPDMWQYRTSATDWTEKLVGYKIEAIDGDIGKIDQANTEIGAQSIVVDTGPWIFGQKVMLPAGIIQRVDHAEQRVWVNATKDRIKNAPEYSPDLYQEAEYRNRLGEYYMD
jgi:hypothetical protein